MEEYMAEVDASDLGKVEIDPAVVRIIAALSCMEVEGVAGMSGGIVDDLTDWFRRQLSKGVSVNISGNSTSIELRVVARYGYPLHQLGREIQDRVSYAVREMTGLKVEAVNVFIVDVEMKDPSVTEV